MSEPVTFDPALLATREGQVAWLRAMGLDRDADRMEAAEMKRARRRLARQS